MVQRYLLKLKFQKINLYLKLSSSSKHSIILWDTYKQIVKNNLIQNKNALCVVVNYYFFNFYVCKDKQLSQGIVKLKST